MKKILPLFLFIPVPSFSQLAPDFTVTTSDGITRNLYDELNAGKTIMLDFFYPVCQGCWYYAPIVEESYQDHGAGTANIEYWGINGGVQLVDDDYIDDYMLQYGITNPCASGLEGNGKYVDSLYNAVFTIIGYPTYAVICPDKTVYWDVNDPVPVATGFDDYFAECLATTNNYSSQVSNQISLLQNPSSVDNISLQIITGKASLLKGVLISSSGQLVSSASFSVSAGTSVFHFPALKLSPGIYFVKVYSVNDGYSFPNLLLAVQ